MEDIDVGQDLQTEHTVSLDEPAEEDVDIEVEAASVTVGAEAPEPEACTPTSTPVLLAADPLLGGGATVTVTVPAGETSSEPFYVQGAGCPEQETELTATAVEVAADEETATAKVLPSGFVWGDTDSSTPGKPRLSLHPHCFGCDSHVSLLQAIRGGDMSVEVMFDILEVEDLSNHPAWKRLADLSATFGANSTGADVEVDVPPGVFALVRLMIVQPPAWFDPEASVDLVVPED